MDNNLTIDINCTYCGKKNEINSQYIPNILPCKFCGDILFELDDSIRNIRVTKRFSELYRILIPQIGEIRKMLVRFEKESKLNTRSDNDFSVVYDSESIIPGKHIKGTGEIIEKLINENKISDEDTRSSLNDLFALIGKYIESVDNFCSQFNGSKQASELKISFRDLRALEKEVNAFVRMMTVYLGEIAVTL